MRIVCLLVVFLVHSVSFRAQNADLQILSSLNARNYPMWDEVMRGTSFSVYPAMPIACGSIFIHGHHTKNKKLIRDSFKSGFAIGIASGAATGLKFLVNRTRPYTEHPDVIVQRDETGPYSFPSGHTTASFATATAVSLTYKKWYVTVPCYAYASLVAYSRMRLGVHYPTDLLGGMALGIGSGFLVWKIDELIQKKQARKQQASLEIPQ